MSPITKLAAFLLVCATGCTTSAPKTFTRMAEPGWSAIEIREGVSYDDAWCTVFNLLSRTFDVDVAMKEEGYLRTEWLYSWSGKYDAGYTVRITVKFTDDRKRLDVKSEALLGLGASKVLGVDSRLASTMKTDLMGTIGRTTR